jgi:phosphoserine phosphatase
VNPEDDSFAPSTVLVTVSGADRPGIIAELTQLVADAGVSLLDLEQAVVQGFLSLHLLLELNQETSSPILRDLLWKTHQLGLTAQFNAQTEPVHRRKRRPAWVLTLVDRCIGAQTLAGAARAAADCDFNIERIERLSQDNLASLELILVPGDNADPEALRASLLQLPADGCDIALQPEGLIRRSKRLVIMDMDSTLIRQEVIDEIARHAGVYEQVAAVTKQAMNGEIAFDEALRARCRALAGTSADVFQKVLDTIELTPGAETLVAVLKRLGYRTAVISGGFVQVVEPLRKKLGLDYAFANELEVKDGRLTGEVLGPIVNRERKGELLAHLAREERISPEQVVAIGDGANDLDMLSRAGLGIAFNAKRTVQEQARYRINQTRLDTVLYLLGIRQDEIEALGVTP